ncbi:hypothetical protein AJ79_00622 [Helicocarpus griseus UAMH5409]|uniref:Rhodopsin domain-containing protein n=1 Tax=Helicocarpus griseus UAMH5409 TaxID=1447875 RepID=A0A2B7YB73_9EURO|nr:hypothetical protein AJ79_00622 [Helicocarpus griseus UAMH5409]
MASGQAPSGAIPEDFYADRTVEVTTIAWVFTGIAIAIVGLKLFARVQVLNKLGWDDFIFFSMILSIIASATVQHSVTLGLGKRTARVLKELGPQRLVDAAFYQIIGYRAFSFPNISIAILIDKLLSLPRKRKIALYSMVTVQVVLAMISIFIVFFQCKPRAALWNPGLGGKCWPPSVINDYSYFLSAYTTVTDIVLAVVPISAFWKLQMKFSTKLGVSIMMGLTLLSAVVTLVKALYLHLLNDKADPLYNVVTLVNWGLVEQNVVIVAACIPTLRPFFHRAFKSEKSSTPQSSPFPSRTFASSVFKQKSKKSVPSLYEIPLDTMKTVDGDAESNSSRQQIWQTTNVIMEWESEKDSSKDKDPMTRGV